LSLLETPGAVVLVDDEQMVGENDSSITCAIALVSEVDSPTVQIFVFLPRKSNS